MKPTGWLTPWEATLEFKGQVQPDEPAVELETCFVAAPKMPVRRRVSIEEFERDMTLAHSRPQGNTP